MIVGGMPMGGELVLVQNEQAVPATGVEENPAGAGRAGRGGGALRLG